MGANVNESGWQTVKRLLVGLLLLLFLAKGAEDAHAWLTGKQCARIACWSTATKHTKAADAPAAAGRLSDVHCKDHAPGVLDYFQGPVGYVVLPAAYVLFVILPLWGVSKLIGIMRLGLGR